MNQSDFALLEAMSGEPEERPQSSYAEVHSCKQSVEIQHVKCEDKMEEVSTNCISNALYGFVGEWKVPTVNSISSSDGMDIDAVPISKEMFEPTRRKGLILPLPSVSIEHFGDLHRGGFSLCQPSRRNKAKLILAKGMGQ